MTIHPVHFQNVPPLAPVSRPPTAAPTPAPQPREAFEQVLERELQPSHVRLSAHAQHRLAQRDLSLAEGQLARLAGAVERAAEKGARDSLVMMDGMALVVNIPNRTVVTAMAARDLAGAVFTRIDSAVIA